MNFQLFYFVFLIFSFFLIQVESKEKEIEISIKNVFINSLLMKYPKLDSFTPQNSIILISFLSKNNHLMIGEYYFKNNGRKDNHYFNDKHYHLSHNSNNNNNKRFMKPLKCDKTHKGFQQLQMKWQCGNYTLKSSTIQINDCDFEYLFQEFKVILEIPKILVEKNDLICEFIQTNNEHNSEEKVGFISRTGKEISLIVPPFRVEFQNSRKNCKSSSLKEGIEFSLTLSQWMTYISRNIIDHEELSESQKALEESSDKLTQCQLLHMPHIFINKIETLHILLHSCDSDLAKIQNLTSSNSPDYSPHLSITQKALPHVEFLEENLHLGIYTEPAEMMFNSRKFQMTKTHRITKSDIENSIRHERGLKAASTRAKSWINELNQKAQMNTQAESIGHKLCVHSLQKDVIADEGTKRDIGVSAGTTLQAQITEALIDKMRTSTKGFASMIASPVAGIATMFIVRPFSGAFRAFFKFLLPLICYFLLLVLLQVLFRYGMNELPPAVNRPCGSIVVAFLSWPIILVVCLTIYHRIGLYVYRNVRQFVLADAVPQVAEPASHQLSHSLTHSITTSLSHTLTHALTHTLSHSLSNSVFHFYRCSYCYHYGDQCDYCFYYRDYSWQWRMAWQGNTQLKPQ